MNYLPQKFEASLVLGGRHKMSSANEVPLLSGASNLEQGREKKVKKVAETLFLGSAGCHGTCSGLLCREEEVSFSVLTMRGREGTGLPDLL